MRLRWAFNRLRNMGPAEVLHRVGEKAKKTLSRRRHEGWERYPAPSVMPHLPGIREAILKAGPEQRAAIGAAAERTLAGRFSALGVDWPDRHPSDPFPADLWRFDPVTGTAWPGSETYTFDISYRHDGSRGDIKYVWEVNRLQFLFPLAAQALLENDARCIAALEAAIESWHAANPPFRGLAWASGIEVALRAITLLMVLTLCHGKLRDKATLAAKEVVAASRFWLPRFPSLHSSANNHLVAELAGEFLLATALGENATRPRAALLAEVQKQILPDGSGAEQTPTYAAFTVELALLCGLVARAAGQPFPPGFDQRLAAFSSWIDWLGAGSHTPALGDDDEGRALALGPEPDYPRSIAAAAAGFTSAAGPAPATGDIRTAIFGAPASGVAPAGLRTFSDGGLSVWHGTLSGRAARLTFDHGPLGYLSIAAHGHADALSITLSLDGRDVLVDPGTFVYGAGGAWRDWFRSTPAHNTLNLQSQSQSLMAGAFNWSEKARTELLDASNDPALNLIAGHDGYRRRFGVTHVRTIAAGTGSFAVTDRLEGGTLPAEIAYQLAAGLEVALDGLTATVSRNARPLLRLAFPPGELSLTSGGASIGGGWVSPRFGGKLPAPRLAWRGPVGPPGVTTTLAVFPTLDTPSAQT